MGYTGASAPTLSRSSVNIVSFVATCLILFVAVQVSDSGFATRISSITQNVDRAMSSVMGNQVNYTEFTPKFGYASNVSFYPSGMSGLYNLTNAFMDAILEKNLNISGLVTVKNHSIEVHSEEWSTFLKKVGGLFAVLVIMVLLFVFFPFCGLCFCCCRCCGNCGARTQVCDKRQDLCKKIVLGTFLIVLTTCLLFCVVCAFASNQQLHSGIADLPDSMKDGLDDANHYLSNTQDHLVLLLNTNYEEFSTVLIKTIDDSSDVILGGFNEMANATAFTDLIAMMNTLDGVKVAAEELKTESNELRVYASQLNDAIRKLKYDLIRSLKTCADKQNECKKLYDDIINMQATIDFNKLPDLTDVINNMEDKIPKDDLKNLADKANETITSIDQQITEKLQDAIGKGKEEIKNAKVTIDTSFQDVKKIVENINSNLDDLADPMISDTRRYIKEYGNYAYYTGVGISTVLVIVSLFLFFGLICGICGKRPDGYSDNCCNKGSGSQFLICGVMVIFITGAILTLVTIVFFVVGIAAERFVCYPLKDPYNSNVLKLLDDTFDLSSTGVNIKLREVLINCRKNESAYVVFNLEDQFDLKKIDDIVESVSNSINISDWSGVAADPIEILDPATVTILDDLAKLEFSIDSGKFKDELDRNFTNYSLDDLSQQLDNIIKLVGSTLPGLVADLTLSKIHVDLYNEKLLIPLTTKAKDVINKATDIDEHLKMGSDSFGDAIKKLKTNLEETEDTINHHHKDILQTVATSFSENVEKLLKNYVDRVRSTTTDNLGKCEPINNVVESVRTATCEKIIIPVNGFWFSLLAALVLFVPIVFVSVKLATLYQKLKSYIPCTDTEVLYDAYAGRESIPMNNRNGKRGKKKNKKSKRYEERPPNSDVVAREYPGGSLSQETRYADMAPKQWEEFPAGGPPQYQRAPTEYERPPPYYYEGSGAQQ